MDKEVAIAAGLFLAFIASLLLVFGLMERPVDTSRADQVALISQSVHGGELEDDVRRVIAWEKRNHNLPNSHRHASRLLQELNRTSTIDNQRYGIIKNRVHQVRVTSQKLMAHECVKVQSGVHMVNGVRIPHYKEFC